MQEQLRNKTQKPTRPILEPVREYRIVLLSSQVFRRKVGEVSVPIAHEAESNVCRLLARWNRLVDQEDVAIESGGCKSGGRGGERSVCVVGIYMLSRTRERSAGKL